MTRRRIAIATLMTMASLVVGVPALAADEAKVSWDGLSWADHIAGPIFELPAHWVPGDEAVGSFWVQNNSSDPATVTVDVISDDAEGMFASGFFTLSTRYDDGEWNDVEPGESFSLRELPGSATTRVSVRGTFDAAADNRTQDLTTDLRFRVALEGRPAVAPPPERSTGSGPLAVTGGAPLGLLLLAAGLVGVGAALRRRDEQHRA